MGTQHLVVDGSNIATEGRSMPSLQQLLDAVAAVTKELDPENVTVIVDATFGHRIESSERARYEEATSRGEIITPPAGVIGRGDAFILEVADRAGAIILSNDSFQEFHGKFDWLFEEGRLLGGKHVPGVGWIFLARSPVRGPTSRRAVSDAKRARRGSKKVETSRPKKTAKASTARGSSSRTATKSAARSRPAGGEAKRKSGGKEPEPYNEPLPFIEFVGAHPVGSIVEGEVEQFSSHGAYVLVDATRCYIPLKAMADPPPQRARDVLEVGQSREFVVVAIDTPRRGIDLAIPGVEVSDDADVVEEEPAAEEPAAPETGTPSPGRGRSRSRARGRAAASEDAAPQAEADTGPPREPAAAAPAGESKLSVSQRRKLRAQQAAAEEATSEPSETVRETMAEKKKAPAKKAAAKKKSTAKKAPARKKAAAKKATAKKTTARKSTAKKATAKKSAAKKTATKKKAAAKKAPAKKKAATKKASAAKKTARKRA